MKNKRGFTLIELLAVIVILAIIALIATPMIMDVIDKARKGAVEDSTLSIVETFEKYSMVYTIDTQEQIGYDAGIYPIEEIKKEMEHLNVDLKGELPETGWIAIDARGNVKAAYFKFKSYGKYVGYTNNEHAKAVLEEDTFDGEIFTGTGATITIDNVEAKMSEKIVDAMKKK